MQDLVGHDVTADWFKIAKQATVDRNALLYLNENKVISDPADGDVTDKMRQFESEVRLLLENDAPNSAFKVGLPIKLRRRQSTNRLQYFEKFNLPIAATEFEMKDTIGDELGEGCDDGASHDSLVQPSPGQRDLCLDNIAPGERRHGKPSHPGVWTVA